MGTVIVPSSDYPLYGDIFNMQGENSMWGIPITSNITQLAAADQDHHELQRGRNILQAMDMFDEYAEGGNSSVLEENKNEKFSHISNDRDYQNENSYLINKENSYMINVDDTISSNNLIIDGVINTLIFSPLTELHDSDELCTAKNDLIASSTVLHSENLLMLPAPFSFHASDQSVTASASDQQSNPCLPSSYEPSAFMPSLDFLSHVHDTSDHIASSCNSRSAACSTSSLQAFNDPKLSSMQAACDHPTQLKPCNSMQAACDHRGQLLQDREPPLETANIACNCAPNHHLDHYSSLYSINNGASAAMRSCSGLLPSCKMVANHEGVQEESLKNIQEKNCSDQNTVSDHAGYDSVCDHGSYTSISDHLKMDGVRDYNVICDQGHDGMCDQGQIDHMVCDHGSYPNHMKMMQREAVYAAAALQPVDWASILAASAGTRPKRRNVRISHDPQTVSARRRRERISDRIRVLQRLVPGGTSMDTASMLDEAIHYLKFLKSQVQALEWLERGSSTLPLSASSSASSCFYPNFTRISLPNHRLIK